MNSDSLPILYVYAPGKEFLMPYIEREAVGHFELSDDIAVADYAVMLSDCNVYRTDGDDDVVGLCEDAPLLVDSRQVVAEADFSESCAARGLSPTVLRCANVVATGMTGMPRDIVNGILRGTYMKIEGNSALISVVHGTEVARAAVAAAASGRTLNVTDGCDTPLNDFVDALAWRLNQKRVWSMRPSVARLLCSRSRRMSLQRSVTFSCSAIDNLYPALGHTPVTEYLRTHVYDEHSL